MSKSREQRNADARERMAAYRSTDKYREWLERSREDRRLRKEKYRREAGAAPRRDISLAAADRRSSVARRRDERSVKLSLHDAHVKRYVRVMSARRKVAAWYVVNADKKRAYVMCRRSKLTDAYVSQNLIAMGIEPERISEGLVALKREAMKFRRLSLQAKTAISNLLKENHEAVEEHS